MASSFDRIILSTVKFSRSRVNQQIRIVSSSNVLFDDYEISPFRARVNKQAQSNNLKLDHVASLLSHFNGLVANVDRGAMLRFVGITLLSGSYSLLLFFLFVQLLSNPLARCHQTSLLRKPLRF